MDLQNAAIWLQNKIGTTNVNRTTANRGCVLLHKHTDHIPSLLKYADEMVKVACRISRPGDPIGSCKLTGASMKIGRTVINRLELGEQPWWNEIAIGNLLLSALLGFGAIKILRDPEWGGNPLRSPYIIQRVAMTEPFISDNTAEQPIAGVSSLFQANKRPLMKRWTRADGEAFSELLSEPFIKAVNTLQQTGWKVNEDVLRVVTKFQAELVPPRVQVPDEEGVERKLALRHNSRADANNEVLRKAEMLLGKPFYQYVDLDWRGRIYYCEHYFNYQGNDLARGLLQFAEGKPLGNSGNFWLAVHTAASYNQSYSYDEIPDWCSADYRAHLDSQGLTDISVDKMTLEDRAAWTANNMDFIRDSLETLRMEAEKPIVFLACCLEWNKAQDNDYVCHLPIPIDGANNGWQHLGAMSKDPATGDLVGLIPREIPSDFYVKCAQKLKELQPEWFAERDIPMKAIRKGIAKRGAMTRAYSAGIGAIAENMAADVWQEGYDRKYNITEDDCLMLARNLVKAIEMVCPGPLKTMKYLQKLAETELNDGHQKVTWTSPSGFPVTQQYYLTRQEDCRGRITPVHGKVHEDPIGGVIGRDRQGNPLGYNGQIKHRGQVETDKPDRKKIASGISPNFVHSQDAAHMAIVLANWDGDFGAVHDSFSTHACDVEKLMDLTRDVFVAMYAQDNYFDNIRDNILTDTTKFEDAQPQLGELDIMGVMDSDYFFA